jgi:hypothetical protein
MWTVAQVSEWKDRPAEDFWHHQLSETHVRSEERPGLCASYHGGRGEPFPCEVRARTVALMVGTGHLARGDRDRVLDGEPCPCSGPGPADPLGRIE